MRHEPYDRWKEPLPAWLTGMVRTFAWLGALGLIYVLGSFVIGMKLADDYPACEAQASRIDGSALDRTRGFLHCLKGRAGLLDGMTLKSTSRFVEPMPLTPLEYQGTWIATRPGSRWRVDLNGDGTFYAAQLEGPTTANGSRSLTGAWSVVDEHFVWLYDEGQVWPPDITPIRDPDSESFNLREQDSSLTHYERQRL
jgi:hypothetical protein